MNILVPFRKHMWDTPFNEELRSELNSLGEVTWADVGDGKCSEEEYGKLLAEKKPEILVTFWGSPLLTKNLYDANPQLKYLCHISGTVRKIVEPECVAAGLLLTNWGNVISRTISEASLLMILGSLRRATEHQLNLHVRKGWRDADGSRSLFERTVGLHGMGPIAQDLIPLLRPFGVKISAYSPNCPDHVFEKCGVERVADLKTLYASNDIISVHTGNTPENFHIVNADILAAMQDNAVLVNTARGPIIDTEALIAELKTGRIFAALDVFEKEPLDENSELRGLENCMLFPHEGGPTSDRLVDTGKLCIANIRRYQAGEETVNQLTADRMAKMT